MTKDMLHTSSKHLVMQLDSYKYLVSIVIVKTINQVCVLRQKCVQLVRLRTIAFCIYVQYWEALKVRKKTKKVTSLMTPL